MGRRTSRLTELLRLRDEVTRDEAALDLKRARLRALTREVEEALGERGLKESATTTGLAVIPATSAVVPPFVPETIEAVRGLGGTADTKSVAERLKITRNAAATRLGRCKRRGLLVTAGRGRFALPDSA